MNNSTDHAADLHDPVPDTDSETYLTSQETTVTTSTVIQHPLQTLIFSTSQNYIGSFDHPILVDVTSQDLAVVQGTLLVSGDQDGHSILVSPSPRVSLLGGVPSPELSLHLLPSTESASTSAAIDGQSIEDVNYVSGFGMGLRHRRRGLYPPRDGKILIIDEEEEPPSPIQDPVGHGQVWPCQTCSGQFPSVDDWKEHQTDMHGKSKRRCGLSLETKVEIVKRVGGGEKQADLADEFGLSRSTVKSIAKKSASYLSTWNDGLFSPERKRLKGAKREDIEAALYIWYSQALSAGTVAVTGPVLCSKALDFARKLGHDDFRATHGWLDRFKKRKNIIFGRSSFRRKRELEGTMGPHTSGSQDNLKVGEWQQVILPQLLAEYECHDIFAVGETAIFYRALPDEVVNLHGLLCSGGVRSRSRITALLCTNMTGSEKFPLLVVGRHPKPASFRQARNLPVQYLADKDAWLTAEGFGAWLQDVDSWLVQQSRRVIILLPASPIHFSPPAGLRAVKLINSPLSFIGPFQQGIINALKRVYRRSMLETVVVNMDRDAVSTTSNKPVQQTPNLLSCLHLLASAWHGISEGIISSSFARAGITKYGHWGGAPHPPPPDVHGVENLTLMHHLRTLGIAIPPEVTFDEYVHCDDDLQVCNMMTDDDIVAYATRHSNTESDPESDPEDSRSPDPKEEGVGIDHSSNGIPPSIGELEAAFTVLRQRGLEEEVESHHESEEILKLLTDLEYLIFKEFASKGSGVMRGFSNSSIST